MKSLRIVALLWAMLLPVVALAQASPSGKPPAPRPIRHVLIVSVDGLLPETYLEPEKYGLKVPTLRQLAREGVWSRGARSVFPSVTYPAHTAIATGTNPGTHGITANLAWDPLEKNDEGWRWYSEDIHVPTLWDAARTRGLRTALIWWPVTVGARGSVVVPEIWRSSTEDDAKLARALATPGVIEAVEKRFPNFRAGFTPAGVKDESLTDIAVHVIETLRPHLLMLHIFEVDSQQHNAGLWTDRARLAIENADRQIARLIEAAKKAGTWQHTALVIVSDHGFAPTTQRVRPGVWLREKGLVTFDERNRILDWKAVLVAASGMAFVYVRDPQDADTRQVLLQTFHDLARKPESGIGRVYEQAEIRAKGGDPEAFLALEAAAGFSFSGGYRGEAVSPSTSAATHGYDPDRPDMMAALLVYGPPIAPGEIENARLIDVAPTVARWLGFRLEKAEGNVLRIGLRPRP